jgi:hypothetical protein
METISSSSTLHSATHPNICEVALLLNDIAHGQAETPGDLYANIEVIDKKTSEVTSVKVIF